MSTIVVALALLVLVAVFVQQVDPLSTAVRFDSQTIVLSAIGADPSILVRGAPLAAFESALNAAITVVNQPEGAPLHGGWLRFILEGGLARLAVILSLLVTPIVIAARTMKVEDSPASSFALSTAIAIAVAIGLQLVSDSPSNNAWALWLTIGCVWGLALGGGGVPHRGLKASAQDRARG